MINKYYIKIYLFLLILIIIMLLFVICVITNNLYSNYPILLNTHKSYDKNVEIVIARYNESLSWTLDYPFNQFKYIVYNKNPDNNNYEKKYVIKNEDLKNHGKCDHTYLYHIVNKYNNLTDVTIFLPGCIDDFNFKYQKAKLLLEYILYYQSSFFITDYYSNDGLINEFYYFKVDNYKSMSNSNLSKNNDFEFRKSKIRPFGEWFKKNLNNDSHNISLFGIFSIDKRDVYKYTNNKYYKLMKSLECDKCVNDELSHYFEKSWESIFYPLKYTYIVPYTNTFSTLLIKAYSLSSQYYKDDYNVDLSASPITGPILWNTIYLSNKMTYSYLKVINNNN
jgi:hypothetical protein